MKRVALTALLVALTGCDACGKTSTANDLSGQPKRVHNNTPLICPDYTSVDVSLGVMRNGVGSMSTQDIELWVPDQKDVDTLNDAIKNGQLVKITYDVYRFMWCMPQQKITKVETL